ncbi:MAG: hypothetical protein ACRC8W_16880 [Plesiomonas shigelloides]
MALNVVYLRVQGRLQQCHVSDGDMMVFRHYRDIIGDHYLGYHWMFSSYDGERHRKSRVKCHEAERKRELYAEKVVKSGQYLIIKGGL